MDWGRARMDLSGITALGVDEIHWRKGKFLTLVYQINEGMKRLLFVAENRRGDESEEILPVVRRAAYRTDPLHLLGHVAALPERDRRAGGRRKKKKKKKKKRRARCAPAAA